MAEVRSNELPEISAPQEQVKKPKKFFLKRIANKVKKSVRRFSHSRSNSLSHSTNLSVEDSAHSGEDDRLQVPHYLTTMSLQATQEESYEEMIMLPEKSPSAMPDIPILGEEPAEEVINQTKTIPESQTTNDTEKTDDENEDHKISHEESHALKQFKAVVTIQKYLKRYLKAKRTSSAMEEMLRKAVQEMEAESPGRREKGYAVAENGGERRSFAQSVRTKRESFFMLKMGIATLIIAVILRYGVLPLLDI